MANGASPVPGGMRDVHATNATLRCCPKNKLWQAAVDLEAVVSSAPSTFCWHTEA